MAVLAGLALGWVYLGKLLRVGLHKKYLCSMRTRRQLETPLPTLTPSIMVTKVLKTKSGTSLYL